MTQEDFVTAIQTSHENLGPDTARACRLLSSQDEIGRPAARRACGRASALASALTQPGYSGMGKQ
jgi:hypothetical protein